MKWLAAFLLVPTTLTGQTPDRLSQLETAWRGWMEEAGVAKSTLAVGYHGAPVLSLGQIWPANRAGALASLSKTITGACVAELAAQGTLSFDDQFDGTDYTLAEMLTHTTGFWPDQTQGTMTRWVNDPRPRHHRATDTALARKTQDGTRGTFAYNNENFALVGALIDEEVGPYAETCTEAVLDPAGVTTARLSPRYGALAAWGGWEMTGADMIRFLAHAFPPEADPFATPHVPLDGGAYYGLGTVFRSFRDGHNYWHTGLHCFEDQSEGSFFAAWENGYSVTVFFDGCLDWPRMGALDTALVKAAYN